mmetsp:Transcript_53603/g.149106  ORF Transcript_53603/g.149106 Transcript_53603/m.149106 type:complete len:394 (-) Transcript_53603:338-1519(-)
MLDQRGFDRLCERRHPCTAARRNLHMPHDAPPRKLYALLESRRRRTLQLVHLVEDKQLGRVGVEGFQGSECFLHSANLLVHSRRRDVHHMEDHVRVGELLEGCAETSHELLREALDETDGVDNKSLAPVLEFHSAPRRVQGLEQPVLSVHFHGVAQSVKQRRFSSVRVSNEGNQREAELACFLPLFHTILPYFLDFSDHPGHLGSEHGPVHLELRFALAAKGATGRASLRPTCGASAAGLKAATLREEVPQARQHVALAGERHLQHRLFRPRPCREYPQDEGRAVKYCAIPIRCDAAFEGEHLLDFEVLVDDHHPDLRVLLDLFPELFELPASDWESTVLGPPLLQNFRLHMNIEAEAKRLKFLEGFFRRPRRLCGAASLRARIPTHEDGGTL